MTCDDHRNCEACSMMWDKQAAIIRRERDDMRAWRYLSLLATGCLAVSTTVALLAVFQ